MGIGHAAVALGASRAEPRVNLGVLIFAAFLVLTFTFPYSHGLVPLVLWGALLGALLCWLDRRSRPRAFWVIAALVLSHFVLDGLVHVRGLPLFGENSPKVGLALWNHLPLELSLETLMAAAGLAIYWRLPGSSKVGRVGVALYVLLLTALTWTQLFSRTPPTNAQLVPVWIIAPLVFSAIPYLFDRRRTTAANA